MKKKLKKFYNNYVILFKGTWGEWNYCPKFNPKKNEDFQSLIVMQ